MSTRIDPRVVRVAVATERRPKVEAVRRALAQLAPLQPDVWSNVELLLRSTDSGVRATPLSDAEMRRGARQRALTLYDQLTARAAPQAHGGRTLVLGLEGGVHLERDHDETFAWLRGWAFATDGRAAGWGCGPSIALPATLAQAVVDGEDLALVIDRLSGEKDVRSRGGTWGILTRNVLSRAATFEVAVLAALSRFYNPEPYAS